MNGTELRYRLGQLDDVVRTEPIEVQSDEEETAIGNLIESIKVHLDCHHPYRFPTGSKVWIEQDGMHSIAGVIKTNKCVGKRHICTVYVVFGGYGNVVSVAESSLRPRTSTYSGDC